MKGLILTNAFYETDATRYQSERIRAELEGLGVAADIKKNDFFGAEIEDGKLKNSVTGYDFCVFLDKDKYVSYALEKLGLRLFNSHAAIRVCDDKAVTFLRLANNGIPLPKTLPGLLCYTPDSPVPDFVFAKLKSELGFPMIVKECYGSLGKFVYKVENSEQLEKLCGQLKCTPHLFQQFISESAGKDVRVTVIGGKAVAAMKRQSDADFRSNIGLGGTGTDYKIDHSLRTLTERTAKILNLDYCGIDVLFGKDGYMICEVNSNAFFGGTERATGINVAALYARHIVNCMKN